MSARPRTLRLCCAVTGVAAAVAAASSCFASGSLGALLACRRIEASAARLACFDRESAALAGQRSSAEPHAALGSRETFGLAPMEVAARAEAAAHAPKPLDSMTAHISSIAKAADGREIFMLDNRQVWVQLTADGNWLDARTGEPVKISRGWLDSYWLSLPDHRGFKVTRVR
jgi:hypothetical protein